MGGLIAQAVTAWSSSPMHAASLPVLGQLLAHALPLLPVGPEHRPLWARGIAVLLAWAGGAHGPHGATVGTDAIDELRKLLSRTARDQFLFCYHLLSAYLDDAVVHAGRVADSATAVALNAVCALVQAVRPGPSRTAKNMAPLTFLTILPWAGTGTLSCVCAPPGTAQVLQRHVGSILARASRCVQAGRPASPALVTAAANLFLAMTVEQVGICLKFEDVLWGGRTRSGPVAVVRPSLAQPRFSVPSCAPCPP